MTQMGQVYQLDGAFGACEDHPRRLWHVMITIKIGPCWSHLLIDLLTQMSAWRPTEAWSKLRSWPNQKRATAAVNFNGLCWLVNSTNPWCGLTHTDAFDINGLQNYSEPSKIGALQPSIEPSFPSCHWLCLSPPAGAVVLCIPTGRFFNCRDGRGPLHLFCASKRGTGRRRPY